MVRIILLILGIVSGLGHVLIGKRLKGLLFFFLFITFANFALLGKFLFEGPYKDKLFIAGTVGAAIVWIVAYLSLIRALFGKKDENNAGS